LWRRALADRLRSAFNRERNLLVEAETRAEISKDCELEPFSVEPFLCRRCFDLD